jgi:hypothetical protein
MALEFCYRDFLYSHKVPALKLSNIVRASHPTPRQEKGIEGRR